MGGGQRDVLVGGVSDPCSAQIEGRDARHGPERRDLTPRAAAQHRKRGRREGSVNLKVRGPSLGPIFPKGRGPCQDLLKIADNSHDLPILQPTHGPRYFLYRASRIKARGAHMAAIGVTGRPTQGCRSLPTSGSTPLGPGRMCVRPHLCSGTPYHRW